MVVAEESCLRWLEIAVEVGLLVGLFEKEWVGIVVVAVELAEALLGWKVLWPAKFPSACSVLSAKFLSAQ